jgi:hypothetical protein
MKRIISKIGYVYRVKISDTTQRYFQYVANDITQLNSSVIRVFKSVYPITEAPDLNRIIEDEVDFYAHVVIRWGIEMGLWEKIGKISEVGMVDILFRQSEDRRVKSGEKMIEVSEKWWVWKINEKMKYVGKLEKASGKTENGAVKNPIDVVERMRTGKYKYKEPGFDC